MSSCATFLLETTPVGGNCAGGVPAADSTVTLGGREVPEECYDGIGASCPFELCDDDLENAIAELRITAPNPTAWSMRLTHDGQVIRSTQDCDDGFRIRGSTSVSGLVEVDARDLCECFVLEEDTSAATNCLLFFAEESVNFVDESDCDVVGARFDLSAFIDDNDDQGELIGIIAGAASAALLLIVAVVFRARRRSMNAQDDNVSEDGEKPLDQEAFSNPLSIQTQKPPSVLAVATMAPSLQPNSRVVNTYGTGNTPSTVTTAAQFQRIRGRLSVNTGANTMFSSQMVASNLSKRSIRSFRTEGRESAKFINERFTMATGLTGMSRFSALSVESLSGLNDEQKTTFLRTTKKFQSRQRKVVEKVFQRLEVLDEEAAKEKLRSVDDDFASVEVPEVSIEDYIERLQVGLDKYFDDLKSLKAVGVRAFLISVLYIEKLKEKDPDFMLSVLNQHRVFAITMLIAAKFSEDYPIPNTLWSMISGLEIGELNEAEEDFCRATEFEFWVKQEDLDALYAKYELKGMIKSPRKLKRPGLSDLEEGNMSPMSLKSSKSRKSKARKSKKRPRSP